MIEVSFANVSRRHWSQVQKIPKSFGKAVGQKTYQYTEGIVFPVWVPFCE